ASLLPIGALFVLADVVVVTEVEVHFLPTLRWPSVLFLKFLGRLWPILVRVDRRRLITAVHVKTDRVQNFIIGHLRYAGCVAARVLLLESELSLRLRAQPIHVLWCRFRTFRQATFLHEALIVFLSLHAGTLCHHLIKKFRALIRPDNTSCDNAHCQQEARQDLHVKLPSGCWRPLFARPGIEAIGLMLDAFVDPRGELPVKQPSGFLRSTPLAKGREPHILMGVRTRGLRFHYPLGMG